MPEPTGRPRRDSFLADLGEDLEDLSGVAESQVWQPDGPAIDRRALELLFAGKRVRARGLDDASHRSLAMLQEADLLDEDGRPTPTGARLRQIAGEPQHTVRVEASAGLAPFTFDAYSRGDATLVVLTASPAGRSGARGSGEAAAAVADQLWLLDLPTGWLPVELAGWLGVGPAWSTTTEPEQVPLSTIAARVDDPETPAPAGSDVRLRHVWAQPWFMWSLQTSAQQGVAAVGAGSSGHFELVRIGDDVLFRAWPSETVFGALAGLCLA
jgi:hypothetical protein